jgi:hypothetical protein
MRLKIGMAVMAYALGLCSVLSASMIPDGDFSTDPLTSGWGTYSPESTATYTWNSVDHYETMSFSGGNTNWFLTLFALEPEIDDQGYDFSADINCYNAHPTQAMAVTIAWFNESMTQLGWDTLVPQQGATDDWTLFTCHIDAAPAGATQAWISFEGRWYGVMEIDNVSFVAVPEPATIGLLSIGGLVTLIRRRRA